mgnify:CR=1 FL=1
MNSRDRHLFLKFSVMVVLIVVQRCDTFSHQHTLKAVTYYKYVKYKINKNISIKKEIIMISF